MNQDDISQLSRGSIRGAKFWDRFFAISSSYSETDAGCSDRGDPTDH
jgi:hypothetical protein